MSGSAVEITNLLYRYAECIDAGELDEAADLFAHATLTMAHADGPQTAQQVLALLGALG
jgi:hypothetical protein